MLGRILPTKKSDELFLYFQEKMVVSIGLRTERGARLVNEDYAGCVDASKEMPGGPGVVAAIADGVGGAKGGRVAAELAVRGFIEACLGLDTMHGVKRNATVGLSAINAWLHALGRADPALAGMASTFTALVLHGRMAHVIHVGDSRLYRLRENTLTRMTTDHVQAGGIRNILTRALGAETEIRIDYAVEPAREHDRYLLCSDGLHGGLSDRAIKAELQRRAGPQQTVAWLVQSGLEARVGDNTTALLVDVVTLPESSQFDLAAEVDALPILPAPRTGAVTDQYRLGSMLSDGQYSRVFRAVDETDGRIVIMKFPKAVVGAESVLRQAFLREAWIAARLSSPWVAEVIEATARRRHSLYTVMPFYEGETLEQRLRRAPRVSRAEGLGIAGKLAKGVAALHRQGVIHRDIKPDNVLIAADGGLKLLDLGVARLPNIEDFPNTDMPGTPSYMAPELFAGVPADERSDLYAFGVTIYRMFTGAYPYGEIEPFSKPRFTRPPVAMLSHRPDLPAWLDQVVRRLIAVNPADRFEDAVELLFALENSTLSSAPAAPRFRPLLERDPLRFWQITAALLAIALVAVLARL
jgi:serine/threonine protein phosphatase PrpC